MLRDWDGMMSSPDLDLRICNAVHTCGAVQLCCVCVCGRGEGLVATRTMPALRRRFTACLLPSKRRATSLECTSVSALYSGMPHCSSHKQR